MLNKPVAIFDLETTGLSTANDRIIEIGILKVHPDGTKETFSSLVNPQVDIPQIVTEITGITNDHVKDSPTFRDIAEEVYEFMRDCDLCGFNSNKFDIPLLIEEFKRACIKFLTDNRALIDVCYIFKMKERRNLENAYRFYCNKELENAHSAMADLQATWEVLNEQVKRYPDLIMDSQVLHDASKDENSVDLAEKLAKDKDGNVCINFGKHKGVPVHEIAKTEPSYLKWILNADFTDDTKNHLRKIFNG